MVVSAIQLNRMELGYIVFRLVEGFGSFGIAASRGLQLCVDTGLHMAVKPQLVDTEAEIVDFVHDSLRTLPR
jgi:hypothetical protein